MTALARSTIQSTVNSNGAHRVRLKPCSLCGRTKGTHGQGEDVPGVQAMGRVRQVAETLRSHPCRLRGDSPGTRGRLLHLLRAPRVPAPQSIDHDHALPEARAAVRGLLCRDCNYSRLPRFEEDVAMLQRAISYLTAPPAWSVIPEGARRGVSVRPTDLGLSLSGEDDGGT